jgi:dissimilatory sulfite reductase (desulfoviridin) alpha/beta subunit
MRCWTACRPLWRSLTNDFVDVNDAQVRGKRADEVQKLAEDWLEAWVEAVGYSTQGLYIHMYMMHAHIADWVRELGYLRPYQSVKKVRKDGKKGHSHTQHYLLLLLRRS